MISNEIILFTIILFVISFNRVYSKEEEEMSLVDFQYNIFKTILFSKLQKNVVISPLSIHQLISSTANGATGSTQNQMVSSLKSKNVVDLNREHIKLNTIMYVNSTLYNNFIIANGLFSKNTPKRDFIEFVTMKYNSTIEQLLNAEIVNQWCMSKTKSRIPNVVFYTESMSILLVSAVSFSSQWKYPFKDYQSTKEKFNENQTVSMMHQLYTSINYYENENVKIIELPFIDSNISSVIILPSNDIQIDIFLANLSNDIIKEYLSLLSPQDVKLSLPKFELGNDIVLDDIMKQLGMLDAFDAEKAKFSSINEQVNLYISQIKHKTFFKVDEKGIDITTLSSLPFKGVDLTTEGVKEMNVNHSFFFGIRHTLMRDIFILMCKIDQLASSI